MVSEHRLSECLSFWLSEYQNTRLSEYLGSEGLFIRDRICSNLFESEYIYIRERVFVSYIKMVLYCVN